jgi:hypothetical protein
MVKKFKLVTVMTPTAPNKIPFEVPESHHPPHRINAAPTIPFVRVSKSFTYGVLTGTNAAAENTTKSSHPQKNRRKRIVRTS